MIVTVPFFTAVTLPLEDTLAIVLSLLFHVSFLLEGVAVTKDANGVSTYNTFVDDMPYWSGEIIADVTLNGTISADGIMNMTIDVLWDGIPIRSTITTNKLDGVEKVTITEQGEVVYYNLQGIKVANPENGVFIRVQGGKASKVIK